MNTSNPTTSGRVQKERRDSSDLGTAAAGQRPWPGRSGQEPGTHFAGRDGWTHTQYESGDTCWFMGNTEQFQKNYPLTLLAYYQQMKWITGYDHDLHGIINKLT